MAGYPHVERRISARLPTQSGVRSPAHVLATKAPPYAGPSNAANRAQARKQKISADEPCQPRQVRSPLQKSRSLQTPSSPTVKKSPSSARLEKPTRLGESSLPSPKSLMKTSLSGATLERPEVRTVSEQLRDQSPWRPAVPYRRTESSSPRLSRQHSLPENLREAAVRLVSPRQSRSKSPEGVAFAPVLGRSEKPERPQAQVQEEKAPGVQVRTSGRWSLQPRQGISRRFSALSPAATKVEGTSGAGSPSATPVSTPTQQKRFSLQRFTEAQKDTFARAISEIRAGRKSSCWMWFVIPTPPYIVHGVEKGSSINRKFAVRSDDEARAYLTYENDAVNLRQNYLDILTAVRDQLQSGKSVPSLMGTFDAPKLASSVRLFERVTRGSDEELHTVLQEVAAAISAS